MHWAAKYIGLPYSRAGENPLGKGVDCWGLLRLVYRQEFGIELAEIPGIALEPIRVRHRAIEQAAEQDWQKLSCPVEGTAVAMSQSTCVHHVGVWTEADGGKVVHSWDGQAVVADTRFRLRLKGIRTIEFYQHRLWPQSLSAKTPSTLSS